MKKHENQLHLFQQLEQCSQKQINCKTAFEFLKLCQNLELTPTFAKVDQTKSKKWKRSAKTFEENVVTEIHQKTKRLTNFRKEGDKVYNEISEKCPPLRIACIMRMITLRKEQCLQSMNGHTKKILRLSNNNADIDKHIQNLSSYKLPFFQKLALYHGLDFALPQPVSPMEIQATFEKAYWKLELNLSDENK